MPSDEMEISRGVDQNVWYWIATPHGEQESLLTPRLWGVDLAERNRLAWNRWIAIALNDEGRESSIKNGVPEADLAPMTNLERQAFLDLISIRSGKTSLEFPNPAADIDFTEFDFRKPVNFSGFVFASRINSSSSVFQDVADLSSAVFFCDVDFVSTHFRKFADFGAAKFQDERTNYKLARFDDVGS